MKVALPVTDNNITGPGEAMEVHIYEIANNEYKLIIKYENPALKATMTRGIYMLKSIIDKNVDALIVTEIGEPGVRFLKNKIKICYSGDYNEENSIKYFMENKLKEINIENKKLYHGR